MAMLVLGFVLDGNLRGTETLFLHLVAYESAARKTERVDTGLDGREVGARIDERAERHVAADSARTIEIRDAHGLLAMGEIQVDCTQVAERPLSCVALTRPPNKG